jgi:uncharacterized protein
MLLLLIMKIKGRTNMFSIYEESFSVTTDVTLKGTLAIPKSDIDKYPAIVFINGSGGADRDGNLKKPTIEANIYKELAHYLTSIGFITLRYDKRAVGESEGDPIKSGMMDLVSDVRGMIHFLKEHPMVDPEKILLLGHSEGCILGTIAQHETPVAGLILLAGAATNLKEPMTYQNQMIVEEIKKMKGLKGRLLRLLVTEQKIKKQFDGLVNTMEQSKGDTVKYKMKKTPAKWFREHFTYSTDMIIDMLRQSDTPILAITGDKDVQANSNDLERIEQLEKSNAKAIEIKNMDHLLKEYEGEKRVLNIMKQYKKEASEPIHDQLKRELAAWLTERYL